MTFSSVHSCFHAEPQWVLVFRQTAGTYLPVLDWNRSQGSRWDDNFVDLQVLERATSGVFELKLAWPAQAPACQAGGSLFNHFKQTNHPFASSSVTGYESVDASHTMHGWGGLALSSSEWALVDGTPTEPSDNWLYALGTSIPYFDMLQPPGIPGSACAEAVAELWAYVLPGTHT